jgi:hypothetical protein
VGVAARFEGRVGNRCDQVGHAISELCAERGEGFGLPSGGRQVAGVVLDRVVQHGRAGQIQVDGL